MHDANGTPLAKGDTVLIPAKIVDLQAGEEFCNVSLETVLGRRPDQAHDTMCINTGTVVKYASEPSGTYDSSTSHDANPEASGE